MCTKFLKYGAVVFNAAMVLVLISSIVGGVFIIKSVGGSQGIIQGVSQMVLAFVGVLSASLIVNALLSINKALAQKAD